MEMEAVNIDGRIEFYKTTTKLLDVFRNHCPCILNACLPAYDLLKFDLFGTYYLLHTGHSILEPKFHWTMF